MNTPFANELTSALWSDFETENDFPNKRPLLAHYTSASTLEKIVSTNQVWMSNPLYMNDLEELRFGMNAGADDFRSSQRKDGVKRKDGVRPYSLHSVCLVPKLCSLR